MHSIRNLGRFIAYPGRLRFYDILIQNKHLNALQSVFKAGHTTVALACCWHLAICKSYISVMRSYPTRTPATFDTMNHQILLSTLCHFGITRMILRWFDSHLLSRPLQASGDAGVSNCTWPSPMMIPSLWHNFCVRSGYCSWHEGSPPSAEHFKDQVSNLPCQLHHSSQHYWEACSIKVVFTKFP